VECKIRRLLAEARGRQVWKTGRTPVALKHESRPGIVGQWPRLPHPHWRMRRKTRAWGSRGRKPGDPERNL